VPMEEEAERSRKEGEEGIRELQSVAKMNTTGGLAKGAVVVNANDIEKELKGNKSPERKKRKR
jgi:hypothetical protein